MRISRQLTNVFGALAIASLLLGCLLLLPDTAVATPMYDQLTILEDSTGLPTATVDIYWEEVADVGWKYEYHFVSLRETVYQVTVGNDVLDPSIVPVDFALLPITGDEVAVGRVKVTAGAIELSRFTGTYLTTGRELQGFYIVYSGELNRQNISVWGCYGVHTWDPPPPPGDMGVPEPGVLLLLGSGMIALGALSRRKKR